VSQSRLSSLAETCLSIAIGFVVSVVACGWGSTTMGGAKGVGESTTSAVVISLVGIFIADFFLSLMFFQGTGDALKRVSSSMV
jgi:ABC-type transporter Mla maintaining outer membrane lipid asymmetry permease subunit MlaE